MAIDSILASGLKSIKNGLDKATDASKEIAKTGVENLDAVVIELSKAKTEVSVGAKIIKVQESLDEEVLNLLKD